MHEGKKLRVLWNERPEDEKSSLKPLKFSQKIKKPFSKLAQKLGLKGQSIAAETCSPIDTSLPSLHEMVEKLRTTVPTASTNSSSNSTSTSLSMSILSSNSLRAAREGIRNEDVSPPLDFMLSARSLPSLTQHSPRNKSTTNGSEYSRFRPSFQSSGSFNSPAWNLNSNSQKVPLSTHSLDDFGCLETGKTSSFSPLEILMSKSLGSASSTSSLQSSSTESSYTRNVLKTPDEANMPSPYTLHGPRPSPFLMENDHQQLDEFEKIVQSLATMSANSPGMTGSPRPSARPIKFDLLQSQSLNPYSQYNNPRNHKNTQKMNNAMDFSFPPSNTVTSLCHNLTHQAMLTGKTHILTTKTKVAMTYIKEQNKYIKEYHDLNNDKYVEKMDERTKKIYKRKKCALEGCANLSRSRGLCKAHGGGKRCEIEGCLRSSQSGNLCITHGGGKRCNAANCPRAAQSRGLCKSHGGGVRCRISGCNKCSQGDGLCRTHGGGRKCRYSDGCEKWAQRNGMCISHAGEESKSQNQNHFSRLSLKPTNIDITNQNQLNQAA